jgi:hypothetical protein
MHNLQSEMIQCPYCGEQIEVIVDCSVNEQTYIEDCSVCCRPINFSVTSSDGEIISIDAHADDE